MIKSLSLVLVILGCIQISASEYVSCSLSAISDKGQTAKYDNKEFLKAKCPTNETNVFWNYPVGNIEIKFYGDIDAKAPFRLCLYGTDSIYPDISVYRLLNGNAVKINTKTGKDVCLNSDQNNAVIIRGVGTPEMKYYGVFINYRIEH
jgi:hypothetical protein